MSQPETLLWRAVVLQQFIDAVAVARKKRQRHDQHIARTWLLADSDGFRMVCDAASLPARDVRAEAQRLARAGWPYTKFNLSNGPKGLFA